MSFNCIMDMPMGGFVLAVDMGMGMMVCVLMGMDQIAMTVLVSVYMVSSYL